MLLGPVAPCLTGCRDLESDKIERAQANPVTQRRSSMSRAVGEGKMDILVVEDDPVIGKAVQKGLSEAGHDCTWVKDGKEGLELAMSQKHDVVVLDLLLPGESG